MLASLFILTLVVVLIAGSTIVSMYIRSSAVSRYKRRLRRLPVTTVGTSEEPFYDNTRVAHSEMSQYARHAVAIVLLILVLLALVIIAVMSASLH